MKTGGGGVHYYFAWPENGEVKNATKVNGFPIDVRGANGYVLAPPSVHASGGVYTWETSPAQAPLAQVPLWLRDWLTQGPARRNKPRLQVDDLRYAPGAAEGQRHKEALRLVGIHLSRGEDPEAVLAAALDWSKRCFPAFPPDEMHRIVADLAMKHESNLELSWEPPLPFGEDDLPAFPVEAFPDWLAEFVRAEATATQTPLDLAAMLVLAILGAACAKKWSFA